MKKFDAALGSSPVALLVGESDGKSSDKGALERNFTLREAGEREGLEWLEAIPKSADSGFEKLLLGFFGNDLKSMELFDNFGQVTTLFFSNLDRNPQLSPELFRFTAPAGVDVLGE